jgi:hypothetical protein
MPRLTESIKQRGRVWTGQEVADVGPRVEAGIDSPVQDE